MHWFYPEWLWHEHFPARLTLLICLLCSSLSVFTMVQITQRGGGLIHLCVVWFFFLHNMHFKRFTLLQMLCNQSRSEMFSPQDLVLTAAPAWRKKVQLCCSESLHEDQPIKTFYLGVRFFGIIAKKASCSIKTKTCWSPKPFSNSRSANDVRLGSSPPKRRYYRGWHQRETMVCCQSALLRWHRTKLSFHLHRAAFVWPWRNLFLSWHQGA